MRDFAVMILRTLGMLSCFLVLSAMGTPRARASESRSQFVLIDATFTAASNNTMSSEYAVAPLPGAPANWRTPIDYAAGSIHVRVQVLEKPSARKTLCNVCFKANELTCMPYPDPYTKPGVYEGDWKISSFWQYEMYDWTQAVERVNVVVKDENGRFVQGNPEFFPTKLHVTVTVVPPGERYVKPDDLSGDDTDAGVGVLPGEPAPPTSMARASSMTGAAGVVASAGARGAAGVSATPNALAAGNAGTNPAPPVAGMDRDIRNYIEPGSSCAVLRACPKSRYGGSVSVVFAALFLWRIVRLRRKKFQHL